MHQEFRLGLRKKKVFPERVVALELAAQGSGGTPSLEVVKTWGFGIWGHGLVVVGWTQWSQKFYHSAI